MGLYDIIGEISERNVTKSETGDVRLIGVVVGTVANNYHKDMPGRICVTIPTRDKDRNELKWARLASPSGGNRWGHYFLPEVGDQVLLAFEGGNIEKPYVIGNVFKDSQNFITGAADEDNQFKRITTKNGSTISFEDNKKGEGENDKILIETAGKAHSLLFDNENKLIRFSDKDKKNTVELKTGDGNISIKAASGLTIKVGDTITLTLNGETGAVKIDCSELSVKAGNQIKANSDGMMKLSAAQVSMEASSMFKAESGGMTKIGGKPIKIG
jgi:uncharacterized protein involved in type VI secretion and phage assembly